MRTTPPEWDTALYTGDMWAACTVDVRDYDTWDELPPAEAWAAQDPAADWFSDTGPITTIGPTGGTVTKDWSGPAARTSAVIVLPIADPGISQVIRGRWVAVRAHLTDPWNPAHFIVDPLLVPSAVVSDLLITGLEWNQRAGTLTAAAEDLVTLLGARQLDTGTGPTGHLPAARTAQGVIRELVAHYAPTETIVTTRPGTPDAPWAPSTDPDGTPEPLTGTVWSAIEAMCLLAGLTFVADGPRVHLDSSNKSPVHTGITITETPTVSGVQAVEAVRNEAPTATRVIATGTNAAGDPIAYRVTEPATTQGYEWDATVSVSGNTDTTQLGLAATAHLDYLRGTQESGRVTIPWLPFLEPGDLVTVAWATAPMDAHYIDSLTIPLDPADPLALALRGGSWPTWADEPPTEAWADLDPARTWAQDT